MKFDYSQVDYILFISRNQARVINEALECYFRTHIGQYFDLANDVARNGYEYNKEDPDNNKKFDDYIQRRDDSLALFDKAYAVAAPNVYERKKTPDVQTAIDVWGAIRYMFYLERPEPKDHFTVDAYEPFPITNEQLPKIIKYQSIEELYPNANHITIEHDIKIAEKE